MTTQEQSFRSTLLAERRIVITGADSGIGRQFLRDALAAGAHCAALVRDDAAVAALAEDLPGDACFVADLRDPRQAAGAARAAIAVLNGVDGLVTCAGIFEHRPGLETTLEDWQRVLDINLTGTFEVVRECARSMQSAGRGGIVLISSQIGLIGHSRAAAYAASKSGINGLMRALALELAGSGVRVNAIAPGPIVTLMTAEARADEARVQAMVDSVPLGRLGEPAEVSAAIAFMLSDAASYITGQVLCVDGGVTAA